MSVRLTDPVDERHGRGVRVNAWLQVELPSGGGGKRAIMRALGLRSRRAQPVQARAKGSALVVRMDAHYSPHGSTSRGALRSYLERAETRGPETRTVYHHGHGVPDNVLQDAPLEQWLDRWSLWLNPSEHDVDPYVAIHAVTQELERRFGVPEGDVYAVEHRDQRGDQHGDREGGRDAVGWHLHFVIRAGQTMPDEALNRETVRRIGKRVAHELVQARALERALERRRSRPEVAGGAATGWDKPATEDQLAVLQRAGRVGGGLSRAEASLAIEQLPGMDPSWYERGR